MFFVKLGVLSGFYTAVTVVPCSPGKPPCLSQVPVSSLDNVYSLPAVALLSFHRSMSGTCFTSPVLDLLTCLWPLHSPLCPFTPVSCRAACLSTTGCSISVHDALSPYPVSTAILPLLGVTVSCFGRCEVSPSPFPAAHHLPSATGLCEIITPKTS